MKTIHVYHSVRPTVQENIRYKSELVEKLDGPIVRRALLLHKTSHMRGFLSDVFVAGMDKLPLYENTAPIIAFSHKKIHDVWSLLEFCLGRPRDRFHDVTAVIQAGIHTPIYPWRDLLPEFFRKRWIRPLSLVFARLVGRFLTNFFRAVHTHPVYREGADIPLSEEEYNATLADGKLLGMDFDSFRRYANRTTMESVVTVQKVMSAENAALIIAPEGKYCHDGSVAPALDLLGFLALRKERDTYLLSLSYDELCPDRRGRIDAFFFVSDPVSPPIHKLRIGAFLKRARKILQRNSTVTASHLIAAVLYQYLQNDSAFLREDLERDVTARLRRLVERGAPRDPRLDEEDFRADRIRRFWRVYRKRWLEPAGDGPGTFRVSADKIQNYATLERTVNDLEWNRNHLLHLPGVRDGVDSSRLRSVIAWLRGE